MTSGTTAKIDEIIRRFNDKSWLTDDERYRLLAVMGCGFALPDYSMWPKND